MGIMTRESTPAVVVPDSPAELATPKFTRLEVSTHKQCDRCPGVAAIVEITQADWKTALLFCGNCARKHFRYEHTQKKEATPA